MRSDDNNSSKHKRKRSDYHDDSDEIAADHFHMKTPNRKKSAKGIPERSSNKMFHRKGKGDLTYQGKRSKAGDKEHQHSEIKDSYNTDKSGGDPRKSKDRIHNGRPSLGIKSSQYSEISATRITYDKPKQDVSPVSKRTLPNDTEQKSQSPEYISVSDIERSLSIEGRVRNKKMKGLQWDEINLEEMYQKDAQFQRNANYRPQNWEHERKQAHQYSYPRRFYDRYSPKKDRPVEKKTRPVEKKTGPVNFKDRYVPNARSHEYDHQ